MSAAIGVARQSCKLRLCRHGLRKITPNVSDMLFKPLHTTVSNPSLMEFFEEKKYWGEKNIRVGRAWKLEELRIKNNSDLHKLWYVLLKERNMLMTMEHECAEAFEPFPNPERLDKVKESMHNLEEVVIERNKAFHELETGETGIRPAEEVDNQIGIPHFHRKTEHLIPKFLNAKWRETHTYIDNYSETKLFLALLKEKREKQKSWNLKGQKNHVLGLMRRFPDLDLEAVKEKFPEVDVDQLKDSDEARGHWLP